MMYTIERITAIGRQYGAFGAPKCGCLHEHLNMLDDQASIDTQWQTGHDGCCAFKHNFMGCRRFVGARVALHEELLAQSKRHYVERPYFWLGVAA